MLAMAVDEEHGGSGVDDFRFNQILAEELAYAGVAGGRASGSRCTTTSACRTSSSTARPSSASAGCRASPTAA